MHDAITFEGLGKPTLAVCTAPFEATSRATANTLGAEGYRVAFVEHPIGSRSQAELMGRAEAAYRQGLLILTGQSE